MNGAEKKLTDLYVNNLDMIEEGLPVFVNRKRSEAIEVLNLTGLPDTKVERYKYSNVRERFSENYEKYFAPPKRKCGNIEKIQLDCYEIHLANGYSDEALTILDNGIIYGSLKSAVNRYPELCEKTYGNIADINTDSLAALNTAFMQDGAFIYVPHSVTAEKPFLISNCCNTEDDIYVFSRNLLLFSDNSKAEVIIDSHTVGGSSFLINQLSEAEISRGANVEVVEFQRENNVSTHLSGFYTSQAADSKFQTSIITTDGGFVRNNWYVYLKERGAETHNYGLYMAGNGQHMDNFTNIEHLVADCTSYEKYKGVVSSDGRGVFHGRILVNKDAQRTLAFQENHNLVLSDEGKVYTKPQLEIYADDVKCSHGATVGQLDSLAVFYMRQRGISEITARKLQMYGFVNDIIGKINIKGLAEYINSIAEEKIERI